MPAVARRIVAAWATLGFVFLAGCKESAGPGGGSEDASLSGTVREQGSVSVLADVTVTIGGSQATSDATGHFELTGLPVGTATVKAVRAGYQPAVATVALTAGSNSHDFALSFQEIYPVGVNAVFVPGGAGPLRGAIIILGGPVTSGFVTGDSLTPGSNNPVLEQSLQDLGASLRALASSARVALIGTSTVGLPDNTATDNALLAALSTAASASGHPELANAPVLMFGLSAGAPEAAGFAARHADRAIGLLERAPTGITLLSAPAALAVPAFVMQAELDNVVDNPSVQAVFEANRSQGGLWALAVELGVGHHEASGAGNGAVISWLDHVLAMRLPAVAGDQLVALSESSGWLGNQSTLEIAAWVDYTGNRTAASWLLSQVDAISWQSLGTSDTPD